jgi:hypothetical protein
MLDGHNTVDAYVPVLKTDDNFEISLSCQMSTHHMSEGGKLFLQFKDILCFVHEPNLFCQLTQASAGSRNSLSTVTHHNRFTCGLQAGTSIIQSNKTAALMSSLHVPPIIYLWGFHADICCLCIGYPSYAIVNWDMRRQATEDGKR